MDEQTTVSEEQNSETRKKSLAWRILKPIVIILIVLIIIVSGALGGLQIGFVVADNTATVYLPDYEMMDLDEILAKEILTEEDYDILYKQTGLTKIGVDRAREKGTAVGQAGYRRITAIQQEYFNKDRKIVHNYFSPFICTDHVTDYATPIFLEDGDLLVTSSTHFSGWRIGHAAIVADGENEMIFQATQVGSENGYIDIVNFMNRLDFMVLRIKPEVFSKTQINGEYVIDDAYKSALSDIIEYITTDLKDSVYSIFTGVFTSKDECEKTMCSHLLWYGFKYFDADNGKENRGIDIDSNGGPLVMPQDIANSPYVELVQTFGFNPDKLWK